MATRKQTSIADFEKALAELEEIVTRMERGDQTLDQSLKDFERGMELSRACRKALDDAEQRVEKLIERHGELASEPLTPDHGEE